MELRANYLVHEIMYQEALQNGESAWGGASAASRVEGWKVVFQSIVDHPLCPPSGRFLELGCGMGQNALMFARKGYEVHGIDISASAVGYANETAVDQGYAANFVVGCVTDLSGYENDSFDIVLDGNCLHCIIGEDRGVVLAEVARVLRPGGLFYVGTMCGDPKEAHNLARFDRASRCLVQDGFAYRYMGEEASIFAELARAGLVVVSYGKNINAYWDHLKIFAAKPLLK